jgi:iron complex transport system substrate-binding protein
MMRKLVVLCFTTILVLGACIALPGEATPTITAPVSQPGGPSQGTKTAPPAERIVSLAPSNTEILFALGAASQMVGRDSFSDYPAEAAQIQDIGGGLMALNMN